MDEQEEKEGLEINVGVICRYLLHKWWILVICLVVGAIAGAIFGKIKQTTTYTTQAIYVVGYETDSAVDADYQSRLKNVATNCKTFLDQNTFRYAIVDELKSNSKYDSEYSEWDRDELESVLAKYITVTVDEDNGCAIVISITTEDLDLSVNVCDVVTSIFTSYLKTIYPITNDSHLDFASANTPVTPEPVKSNDVVKFTAIFALVGLLGAAAVLVIYYLADTRVKSGEELSEKYDAAVLGAIPDVYDKDIANVGSYGSASDKEKNNAENKR